ncbi:MAG: response regulator [Oscillospiraceae bacterium]|nr:response regulator [Oscillospiraceae bacterium]
MKQNSILKDKNVVATVIISAVIIILFLGNCYASSRITRARSVLRMEEGVDTVVDEVVSKFDRDSQVLNAAADIISSTDVSDEAAVLETMGNITPLLETMDICILMPDNRILQPDGSIADSAGYLDFETESSHGEHVSQRVTSVSDNHTQVLRHFVPIMQNDQVAAILYGRTRLDELPEIMNIQNIYNACADVYLIDAKTGEFLMDTRHEGLGNLDSFQIGKVRGNADWEDAKRAIMDQKSGSIVFKSARTGEWLNFYYTPAGINQWTIAVSVAEKEALSSMYSMRRVFYLTAILIVLAIGSYYFWMHQNAKKAMKEAMERIKLEEKLQKAEAAEKAKTTFLSNMSHDIRTPMNAIIGFATLVQNNIDNKERVSEYIEKILSSSNYMLSLINDVLDMSRIESGKMNIDEKPCSISEIFRDMRNIIQTQMQSKHLTFFMDTMDVVDEDVYCDKVHINQVLLNLLSNAIKFTPAGGAVFLTIRQKPDAPTGYGSYELRVKDTGIGMSPEFLEHIFEPFERERTSTVSGIQGTGLGMAITKSIVDSMGGAITVKSEEGRGTEFIIQLHLRLQSEPKQVEVSRVLSEKRALVVDDNFSTCDSMTKMLAQLGMKAAWTMYGREAVLRTRQALEMDEDFFAYIVDWALPDLSGLEVVRQIRSIVGDDAIIIVMTAYEWKTFEEEARDAGVTAFCNKPVFLSELRQIMENAAHKIETAPTSPVRKKITANSDNKRLLVVEDNELNREIVVELLVESGFSVETAEDGTIAVEKVKSAEPGRYDMILMDIQMPVMNGYDATKAIRAMKDPAKASIPIIAVTANAFEEDKQHALECGMNDHVAKPIDIEKLLEILKKFLGD